MRIPLLLAALSGAPALVYEVVWTREVALLAGGQIEAISAVLVAFFGGLALGARWIGPRADAAGDPLRLYAGLEALAGVLAIGSSFLLRALAAGPLAGAAAELDLAVACAVLLPITILLGGTLPALLRAATRDPLAAGRAAGSLVGANTAGSVAGVALAAACIPRVGLRATLLAAGLVALAVAALALAIARGRRSATPAPGPRATGDPRRPPAAVLAAAALVGAATLGYEVLATRGAMLRLGSGLYAWALVLALFLTGLAVGNLASARWAARTRHPTSALGTLEVAAALAVALGATWLLPALTSPAAGLGLLPVLGVVLAALPAALLMGSAFPLLVRLGRPDEPGLAGSFGRVSAFNTAGGIAGALVAPFLLLPALGLVKAVLVCAGVNALVGLACVARGAPGFTTGALRLAAALALLAAAGTTVRNARAPGGSRVLSVEHGRQATAVVMHLGGQRTLLVDGEAEAASGGDARVTEELLAVLPLLLHPAPGRLLEVGFGSGITLGTAARFPLAELDCVEIAASVLRSARFFAPDNGDVASGTDPRVRLVHADGRAWLARARGGYDVVLGNTVHPWSVGATGLYSREYFERVRRALRPDGIAVQWIPLAPVGAETVAAILRTLLAVFPDGSLWWAAENLLAVARTAPAGDERATLRARAGDPDLARPLAGLALGDPASLGERRIASFAAAREVLGAGEVLVDDRPRLERLAARPGGAPPGDALGLVMRLAEAGAREDPRAGALRLWLESRAARAAGDTGLADRRERLAEQAGLALARDARLAREVAAARAELAAGRVTAAESAFRRILGEAPEHPGALLGLAAVAYEAGGLERSAGALERLLARHPHRAEAWNLLGAVRERSGDPEGARQAFDAALAEDPYLPMALANAGLNAVARGDLASARGVLARLRAISPLGVSAEERSLRRAIAAVEG